MNGKELTGVLIHMTRVIEDHRNMLCELDSHVGDGDHGVSMTIGMRAARRALEKLPDPTPEKVFRAVAEAFGDEVGASSGVLYEEAFLAASAAVHQQSRLETTGQWSAVLLAMSAAIQKTGHAELGDKTMYDAWFPAAQELVRANAEEVDPCIALERAAEAAWGGVLQTKNLIPKRGRASLLGERARGYQDAGATSASLMVKAIYEGVVRAGKIA